MAEVSGALLRQMIEQNDEKHTDAHHRLRRDLTEGINDVNMHIDSLEQAARADHEDLLLQRGQRERRKELSGVRIVLLSAAIGTLPHFVELVLKAWSRQP